tara:strand:+ start:131 stop:340 length:210 start_codon:yes stop_codon:yes gene_type:complete
MIKQLQNKKNKMSIMEGSEVKSIDREVSLLKYEALNMSVIKMFVEKYPNDQELGKAVREFVTVEFIKIK